MLENQKYQRLSQIGQGVYGEVFAALDQNKQIVAIKKMKNKPRTGIQFTSLREIKILKEFNHRNIIQLKDVFIHENSTFLVLEYCISNLTEINNQICLNGAKHILKQIAQVHRDLTPDNILIQEDGTVKISDFGFSRFIGSPNRLLTINLITKYYRPPEIFFGSDCYGTPVDVWSLGCIFAEMLTKKPIFQSQFNKLGTNDYDQLGKIFYYCGTPNEENWPNHEALPNFLKVNLLRSMKILNRQLLGYWELKMMHQICQQVCYKWTLINDQHVMQINLISKYQNILFYRIQSKIVHFKTFQQKLNKQKNFDFFIYYFYFKI